MPETDTANGSTPKMSLGRIALARSGFGFVMMAAVLLIPAGTWFWPMAWAYLALAAVSLFGTLAYLLKFDPSLLAERMRVHPGTKVWDRFLVPLIALVLPLAELVVAGLDHRFGWTAPYPLVWHLIALVVTAAGVTIIFLAMRANTFFAATVRIQSERAQSVVSHGPYAVVRHPGYTGAMLGNFAVPIVLGSLWALIPAVLYVAVLVVRTALEDGTLQRELAGYTDYAARVRYRLVPGVW